MKKNIISLLLLSSSIFAADNLFYSHPLTYDKHIVSVDLASVSSTGNVYSNIAVGASGKLSLDVINNTELYARGNVSYRENFYANSNSNSFGLGFGVNNKFKYLYTGIDFGLKMNKISEDLDVNGTKSTQETTGKAYATSLTLGTDLTDNLDIGLIGTFEMNSNKTSNSILDSKFTSKTVSVPLIYMISKDFSITTSYSMTSVTNKNGSTEPNSDKISFSLNWVL